MNTLYYITNEISELYTTLYYEEQGPNVPPQDPNAQQAQDPNAMQQDPNAIQQDPNAMQVQDPNAMQAQDPNSQGGTDNPALDPMKKYLLLTKIIELKHYLELYAVSSEMSKDTKNLIKFIGVVIDFYDIFDYGSLRSLSDAIMKESEKCIKHRKDSKGA